MSNSTTSAEATTADEQIFQETQNRPLDSTVPKQQQQQCCWSPQSIKIKGGPDKPDIDIMDSYFYDDVSFGGLIVLSPDVYPPRWEQRKTLQDAVMKAALLQADTSLVVGKTDRKKMTVDLICVRGRCFYSQNKRQNYTGGRSCPRKGKPSNKPMSLEDLCRFKIRITLKTGKCWFLHRNYKRYGAHNHAPTEQTEARKRQEMMNHPESYLKSAQEKLSEVMDKLKDHPELFVKFRSEFDKLVSSTIDNVKDDDNDIDSDEDSTTIRKNDCGRKRPLSNIN